MTRSQGDDNDDDIESVYSYPSRSSVMTTHSQLLPAYSDVTTSTPAPPPYPISSLRRMSTRSTPILWAMADHTPSVPPPPYQRIPEYRASNVRPTRPLLDVSSTTRPGIQRPSTRRHNGHHHRQRRPSSMFVTTRTSSFQQTFTPRLQNPNQTAPLERYSVESFPYLSSDDENDGGGDEPDPNSDPDDDQPLHLLLLHKMQKQIGAQEVSEGGIYTRPVSISSGSSSPCMESFESNSSPLLDSLPCFPPPPMSGGREIEDDDDIPVAELFKQISLNRHSSCIFERPLRSSSLLPIDTISVHRPLRTSSLQAIPSAFS